MTTNVTRAAPLQTPVVRLAANPAAAGSNTLVAAVPGGRIRVLALALVSTAANTVTLLSAANPISGAFDFGVNGGMVWTYNEHGWAETAVGEALNVSLSAATKVAFTVIYQVVGSGV